MHGEVLAARRPGGPQLDVDVLLCVGQLADTEEYIDVELRASWTPRGEDLSVHLEAWADMVCTFAGLPPVTESVAVLRR